MGKSKLVGAKVQDGKLILTFEKEYQGATVNTQATLPFMAIPNDMVTFTMTNEALYDLAALLDGN